MKIIYTILFLLIVIFHDYIIKFFRMIYWKSIDLYRYYKYKQWLDFKEFGLYFFVGRFGSSKTSSLIHHAYKLCLRYPEATLLTNISVKNFPEHTKIVKLTDFQQIVDADECTVCCVDEIQSLLNSRDWANQNISEVLRAKLYQVRKSKLLILCTCQVFRHSDKLLRDIAFYVVECSIWFKRWAFQKYYWADEYEEQNVMIKPSRIKMTNYIQTDKVRELYDTNELVIDMLKRDYLTDVEILEKRGDSSSIVVVSDDIKANKKRLKKK